MEWNPQSLTGPTEAETFSASGMLSSLRSLDVALERAISIQQSQWSTATLTDRFRGLYVGYSEAREWLQRSPGEPLFSSPHGLLPDLPPDSPLRILGQLFSLAAFDLGVITIAVAPEIDLRYERLYAFLQDDVTRKRPSVDLALSILCGSAEEKLAYRARFAPDAPLCSSGIVHLLAGLDSPHPPLPAYTLKLDDRIVAFLLGSHAIDKRLVSFCHLPNGSCGRKASAAVSSQGDEEMGFAPSLPGVETGARKVHIWGGSPLQMEQTALAQAAREGRSLLAADLRGKTGEAISEAVSLVAREARLQHAIAYFWNVDTSEIAVIQAAVSRLHDAMIIATRDFQPALAGQPGSVTLRMEPLSFSQRRQCWENNLRRCSLSIEGDLLDLLARRYRLAPEQIEASVDVACAALRSCAPAEDGFGLILNSNGEAGESVVSSARALSGAAVAAVARKVRALHTWTDLVLPHATLVQLHELCARIVNSEYVLSQWGFDRKLSQGRGAPALFVGPSGTGKTMAAEVIANEIKFDLYKIDLTTVISKYIGETEQNLDRIFTAAQNCSVLLFFDEADALFGKRSEVRDSHDRYANIEISYLLQKLEAYDGAAILATNLGQNIDEAFLRRFAFSIRFPFPDEAGRRRIWSTIWPQETPLVGDIDFDYLAGRFRLAGGNIKNAALAAAFLAASDGGAVSMTHVLEAIEREFDKMGKSISSSELIAELRTWQQNSEAT